MNWPLDKQNVPGRSFINPMASVPLEQFGRSLDRLPKAQGNGGGGNDFVPPMWLISASSTEVLVTLATVNGITPTGIAANIDVSGTDGTWYVYVHATLDDAGAVTAAEILSNTTGVPAEDAHNSYRLVGQATVASSLITAVSATFAWSKTFSTCNRDSADPTTTPGLYYWNIGG